MLAIAASSSLNLSSGSAASSSVESFLTRRFRSSSFSRSSEYWRTVRAVFCATSAKEPAAWFCFCKFSSVKLEA
uniref:Putative secreted protein n=1 Tax=Anopheles triannulatus TaxID=58253 RepID=A0A2M4B8C4_9DIPT